MNQESPLLNGAPDALVITADSPGAVPPKFFGRPAASTVRALENGKGRPFLNKKSSVPTPPSTQKVFGPAKPTQTPSQKPEALELRDPQRHGRETQRCHPFCWARQALGGEGLSF